MNGHTVELDVIDAAKDVARIWRNEGQQSMNLSTAIALMHNRLSKLRLYREGRREEAIQESRL